MPLLSEGDVTTSRDLGNIQEKFKKKAKVDMRDHSRFRSRERKPTHRLEERSLMEVEAVDMEAKGRPQSVEKDQAMRMTLDDLDVRFESDEIAEVILKLFHFSAQIILVGVPFSEFMWM